MRCFYESSHRFKRINIARLLVGSQPKNSWKTKGVTAFMPLRRLNSVKCDLDHNCWFHDPHSPMRKFLQRMILEPLRQFHQLTIRKSRVGFANVQQFVLLSRASHSKSVVRQQVSTFSVTNFHCCDDNIECCNSSF